MGSGLSILQLRCGVPEDPGQVLVGLHLAFDPMDGPATVTCSKYFVTLKWRLDRPDPNHCPLFQIRSHHNTFTKIAVGFRLAVDKKELLKHAALAGRVFGYALTNDLLRTKKKGAMNVSNNGSRGHSSALLFRVCPVT